MDNTVEQTNVISTYESVYRDSSIGNLDRVEGISPLQQRFDSDSKTCFSITIHNQSAFRTSVQRIVLGIMSFLSQSTAVATPFRGVSSVYDVQSDIIIKTSLLKNLLELIERYPQNLSIETLMLPFESSEILDGNLSIELLGNLHYLSNHLTEVGFDEVLFIGLDSLKILFCLGTTFGGKRLKHSSPFHNPQPCVPDMLTKVRLIQDFASRRENRDSEMPYVDINTKNIRSLRQFSFFGQVCDNLEVRGQPEGLAYPSPAQMFLESIVIPILFNAYGNLLLWVWSEFYKEIILRFEYLTVSRDVELDSRFTDFIAFTFCNPPLYIADNLGGEGGVFLAD